MTTIILVIETETEDPNDVFTFPAPRGVAVALTIPSKIKAIVAETDFVGRVNLLRGNEAEAEVID